MRAAILAAGVMMASAFRAEAAVPEISGTVKIDGSSTVYPITEAVAEEFGKKFPSSRVTVGISGTGGGFKKFCAGETDISEASRPIKSSEIEACAAGKIQYVELPIGFDALTIVVNPKNTWISSLTLSDLKKIWEPSAQGKVLTWNQVRPEWPNQPIRLYGPGTDSGTYDYFTEVINGKQGASRGDYTSSEDDNVLVQGVASDVHALGYFGLKYYEENSNKLKAVAIDSGSGLGAVVPSPETVIAGKYHPLSRPLFTYVRLDALERPEVAAFIRFYVNEGSSLVREVGYIPLQPALDNVAKERLAKKIAGSVFGGKGFSGGETLENVYKNTGSESKPKA